MKVYLLWHAHDLDEEVDVKLIGVYSTEQLAMAARERIEDLPGFLENPMGFYIGGYEVDRDQWTCGFVTVRYGPNGEPHDPGTKQGESQ